MPILVGTSGWQYRHWRGRYYPRSLAQAHWLGRYATDFATVELNVTFYRLPEPDVFAAWADETPDDFVFAVKASRYLTHVRRLREPRESVERLMAAAGRLGSKLGPVLLQLPPNMKRDARRLDEALAAFPSGVRVAVEFRHASWLDDETDGVLAAHDAAFCLTDRDGERSPVRRTAGWTYLRLHAGCATPQPCYEASILRSWGRALRDGWGDTADAYVYFNNDGAGCAVRDAGLAGRLFSQLRLGVTRTPDPDRISVG